MESHKISIPGVKHTIAVASGKGGVGKSTVTTNLAFALSKAGAKVGLLDADLYGPSIPTMVGVTDRPEGNDQQVKPVDARGVKVMSIGLLVDPNQPVVWRGPMVHGALTQFLTQVDWGELDYLLIDMPPGTGDAQLTISQNAPLSGAIIVTTPQKISWLDARKGLMMFQSVNVPILGVVENMSGAVFGTGGGADVANEFEVPFLGSVPLQPEVVVSGDSGTPIVCSHPGLPAVKAFEEIATKIVAQLESPKGPTSGFRPISLEWQ